MIPRTFGESLRRVRHRFDRCPRRPDVDRELSRGRAGSGAAPSASALGPQPSARGRQPSARRAPHSALGPQPSALGLQPSALSTQPLALSPRPSALGAQPSALSTQHSAFSLSTQPSASALSLQPSAFSPRPSALGAQHSALSTQPSALSPRPSAVGTQPSALSFGFGPQPRPSHSRTVRPAESCPHPFVSSERPRTPQPRSLGPVRTHSSGAPMIPRTSAPRVASGPNAGRKGVRNTRIQAHGDLEPPT